MFRRVSSEPEFHNIVAPSLRELGSFIGQVNLIAHEASLPENVRRSSVPGLDFGYEAGGLVAQRATGFGGYFQCANLSFIVSCIPVAVCWS